MGIARATIRSEIRRCFDFDILEDHPRTGPYARQFFAETEQVAFMTQNVPQGVDFSNDPLPQSRNSSSLDAQLKRLGSSNFTIPDQRSKCPFHHFQRDGHMPCATPWGEPTSCPTHSGKDLGNRRSTGFDRRPLRTASSSVSPPVRSRCCKRLGSIRTWIKLNGNRESKAASGFVESCRKLRLWSREMAVKRYRGQACGYIFVAREATASRSTWPPWTQRLQAGFGRIVTLARAHAR